MKYYYKLMNNSINAHFSGDFDTYTTNSFMNPRF